MTKLNKVEETLMFSGFFDDKYGTCKLILILCFEAMQFFLYIYKDKRSLTIAFLK